MNTCPISRKLYTSIFKQNKIADDYIFFLPACYKIRKRLADMQGFMRKCMQSLQFSNKILHVNVSQVVTVNLPPGWKPRRERQKIPI